MRVKRVFSIYPSKTLSFCSDENPENEKASTFGGALVIIG